MRTKFIEVAGVGLPDLILIGSGHADEVFTLGNSLKNPQDNIVVPPRTATVGKVFHGSVASVPTTDFHFTSSTDTRAHPELERARNERIANMSNVRKWGFSALAALILTALAYAQAPPVSFEFTNEPGIGEANILFGQPQQGPATTITGTTVHGIFSAPVSFTATRSITAKGGQSNIEPCTNGVLADCPNGLITSLKVTVPGPGGVGTGFFMGLILDPQKTAGDHDLFALVATNMGPVTSPAFGDHLNGNNFLTIEPTTPGVEITSVTLTSTGGFLDLKQPRVLGVNGAPPIPEPSSILLMASGMLGLSRVLLRKLL